jgi:hypothetical protein
MDGYKYVSVKFSGKIHISFSGVNLHVVCGVVLLKNTFTFGPNFCNNTFIYIYLFTPVATTLSIGHT